MKKLIGVSLFFCAVLCLFVAVPAKADTLLYTNGAINGTIDGGGISVLNSFSDSFTIATNSTLTVATVGLWLTPGDTPTAVDWAIGTTPFGSNIAAGISNFFNQTNLGLNASRFDIWQSSLDIGGTVPAGTYWFSLSGATTPSGDFIYWDLNLGPSSAEQGLSDGTHVPAGSESFQIYGTTTATATPEPSSLILLGTGLLGLARVRRHRVRI